MPYIDTPLPEAFHVEPIVPRKRGNNPNLPRKRKGQVNKITRDVKQGILEGAIAFGSDGEGTGGLTGYFEMCAAKFPKAYMHLLGKLIPLNITGDNPAGNQVLNVQITSIPSGTFLSHDEIVQLGVTPQTVKQIEHSPSAQPEQAPVEPELNQNLTALETELSGLSDVELRELAEALLEDTTLVSTRLRELRARVCKSF